MSFGGKIKLTKKEKIANEIIMDLKERDLNIKPFIPSRHIFQSLKVIAESKLFKIIQKMPKGAILHTHETAMCSANFVVTITHWKHLWQRVTKATNLIIAFKFSKVKPELETKHKDICEWQLVAKVRASMNRTGQNYDEHVRTFFTLYDKNVNPRMQFENPDILWAKFHHTFDVVGSILKYEPARRAYFAKTLKEMLEDGVQYLEFRGGMAKVFDIL